MSYSNNGGNNYGGKPKVMVGRGQSYSQPQPQPQPPHRPQSPKKNSSTLVWAIIATVVAGIATVAAIVLGVLLGTSQHVHSFGEWSTTKAATCEENGGKERYCSCGEKQTDEILSNGHSFGAWTVVSKATCVNEGSEKRECSCGEMETRSIDKLTTHEEVVDARVEPTCKNTGLTEGKHCSKCGEIIISQQTIEKDDTHTYDDKYDADCNICGFERDPACRHENTVSVLGRAATCTVSGLSDGKKCSYCGVMTVPQQELDAVGHTAGKWVTDKEATCTEAGRKHQECSVCFASIKTESISATGHSSSTWIYDKQPTCTEGGQRHKVCSICTQSFANEAVSANGHTYSSWICVDCSEADPSVTLIYKVADLSSINRNLGGTYVLMNDIDCNGIALSSIGSKDNPFVGIFNGRGHTISNFTLSADSSGYTGLFISNSGTIKNLNIQKMSISVASISASTLNMGGLCGYNSGRILQCSVNAELNTTIGNQRYTGMITAQNNGFIQNCVVLGIVSAESANLSNSVYYVGGVCGRNYGQIDSCFVNVVARGHGHAYDSKGGGNVGAICGYNDSKASINKCLIMGSSEGNTGSALYTCHVGDVCGKSVGTIEKCYKDSTFVATDGYYIRSYATEVSCTQMNNTSFYSISLEWDTSLWNLSNLDVSNGNYPKLIQN